MKKICHITSSHKARDQRIFLKQCKSLAREGYDVTLVNRFESFEEDGVNVVGLGYGARANGSVKSKWTLLKKAMDITKACYIKALEIDADIYQIHDPELLPYALKLKKKGKIVIFDSHENYIAQFVIKDHGLKKFFKKKVYATYLKYVFDRMDAIFFPCLHHDKPLYEGKCKRVITIGNEPLLEEFYHHYDENITKKDTVCYVGGLTYERGLTHSVKACHQSKVTLTLGGLLPESNYGQQIQKEVEFSCVDYRGFCTRSEVLSIYQESKIGLCTILNVGQYNKYDNFATKVYEYMSVGLPVIMSDYHFARKINEKYQFAILVDPENINQISDAITYLLEHPEEAKKMGENGRRAVLEEFNWGIEEKKLFALYEELGKEV